MARSERLTADVAVLLGGCVAAALVGPLLGVLGGRWVFPAASTLVFLPLFWRMNRQRSVRSCFALTLVWVLVHSATSIALAHHDLGRYESAVFHGAEYRQEMFHWLATGVGAEGDPGQFLPVHALHLGVFLALCWISRSALGLLLGVLLLNYMNAYVGALTREGNPWLLALVGWHPWAVLRVMGFLLAAILVARRGRPRRDAPPDDVRAGWTVVGLLILGDVLLKAALAPWWREWIRSHMMG